MFDIHTMNKEHREELQKQLWQAAEKGLTTEIRKLVVAGADVTARDEDGRTALNIASQYGHAKAYQTLMAARAMAETLSSGMPADMLVRSLEQEEERQRHYG